MWFFFDKYARIYKLCSHMQLLCDKVNYVRNYLVILNSKKQLGNIPFMNICVANVLLFLQDQYLSSTCLTPFPDEGLSLK